METDIHTLTGIHVLRCAICGAPYDFSKHFARAIGKVKYRIKNLSKAECGTCGASLTQMAQE